MAESELTFDPDVHSMLMAQGLRLGLAGEHWLECTIMPDDGGDQIVLFERGIGGEERCALPDRDALQLLLQWQPEHLEPEHIDHIWRQLLGQEKVLRGEKLEREARHSIQALDIATRLCREYDVPQDVATWRETRQLAFHAARKALKGTPTSDRNMPAFVADAEVEARKIVREHAKSARKVQRAVRAQERKQERRARNRTKPKPKKH